MFHFMGAVMGVMLIGVLVLALLAVLVFKMLRGGGSGQDSEERESETRMIQEIYNSLNRMEDRIETLETLLLDKEQEQDDKRDNGRDSYKERDDAIRTE